MYKSIRFAAKSSRSAPLVVGALADPVRVPPVGGLTGRSRDAVDKAIKAPGFKADPGETIRAEDGTVIVGLGAEPLLTATILRRVGGGLVKAMDRMGVSAATIAIDKGVPSKACDRETVARCIAEGMSIANFRVDAFDGSATTRKPGRLTLTLSGHDRTSNEGLVRGITLAESTNYARRIGATPPNICTPAFVAAEARRLARAKGMSCRVISYAEAKRLGMGGLVNVGMGSAAKPCLIILEHKPRRVSSRAKRETIALVGKTLTYDTGGYSLKVNNGMKGMKYDKCGGMAVLGAMHAIAALGLPVHVVALLPAAENMVSDVSYRPDDIITLHNGVTVEVTNTDAEGRLVLADALSYACREIKPTALVDVATLTGGVVVALGSWCAGLFCTDEKLQARIERASESSGERIWPLPLWTDHKDFMRAKHADIWNSGPKRDGHPIQGAAFLSFFVDSDVPWAHLDIAGVAAVESDTDLCVTGPTGYGVRLLTALIEEYA